MKYLILGSSGQIGSALENLLISRGHTVLTFDIVDNLDEDLRLANNQLLINKVKESDFIFFLAFDVGGSRYLKTYQYSYNFLSNNSRIMEFTFEVINKTNTPFIFASSQMSNMNFSPYGTLKALGEFYTKALNGLVVKFWNVYGVEQDPNKMHVITDFLLSAKENKKITMMTNGQEERQFLHTDDCSECLLILSQKYLNISKDDELHITSFRWNSILDVARIISVIFPGTLVIPSLNIDSIQQNLRNEPNKKILDYWKPELSLHDGIFKVAKTMNLI